MNKKRTIPLTILKSLEGFVNLQNEKFKTVNPENNLLKVVDIDKDSNFHFIIEQYQTATNGTITLLLNTCPRCENETKALQQWIEIKDLKFHFETWINLLDEYDSVKSFFDDPILKSFEAEFYSDFEILEEDSEIKPFKITQILLLDNQLEFIETKIEEFSNTSNKAEIEIIKENIIELRSNLTLKSKVWVTKKLAEIFAKIAKQGTKFIKEFVNESKKEIIIQSIKAISEVLKVHGQDLLQ